MVPSQAPPSRQDPISPVLSLVFVGESQSLVAGHDGMFLRKSSPPLSLTWCHGQMVFFFTFLNALTVIIFPSLLLYALTVIICPYVSRCPHCYYISLTVSICPHCYYMPSRFSMPSLLLYFPPCVYTPHPSTHPPLHPLPFLLHPRTDGRLLCWGSSVQARPRTQLFMTR